jgi:uncharacterized protein YcfL
LHGNSIPKIGYHYFWPGLIANPTNSEAQTTLNPNSKMQVTCPPPQPNSKVVKFYDTSSKSLHSGLFVGPE